MTSGVFRFLRPFINSDMGELKNKGPLIQTSSSQEVENYESTSSYISGNSSSQHIMMLDYTQNILPILQNINGNSDAGIICRQTKNNVFTFYGTAAYDTEFILTGVLRDGSNSSVSGSLTGFTNTSNNNPSTSTYYLSLVNASDGTEKIITSKSVQPLSSVKPSYLKFVIKSDATLNAVTITPQFIKAGAINNAYAYTPYNRNCILYSTPNLLFKDLISNYNESTTVGDSLTVKWTSGSRNVDVSGIIPSGKHVDLPIIDFDEFEILQICMSRTNSNINTKLYCDCNKVTMDNVSTASFWYSGTSRTNESGKGSVNNPVYSHDDDPTGRKSYRIPAISQWKYQFVLRITPIDPSISIHCNITDIFLTLSQTKLKYSLAYGDYLIFKNDTPVTSSIFNDVKAYQNGVLMTNFAWKRMYPLNDTGSYIINKLLDIDTNRRLVEKSSSEVDYGIDTSLSIAYPSSWTILSHNIHIATDCRYIKLQVTFHTQSINSATTAGKFGSGKAGLLCTFDALAEGLSGYISGINKWSASTSRFYSVALTTGALTKYIYDDVYIKFTSVYNVSTGRNLYAIGVYIDSLINFTSISNGIYTFEASFDKSYKLS